LPDELFALAAKGDLEAITKVINADKATLLSSPSRGSSALTMSPCVISPVALYPLVWLRSLRGAPVWLPSAILPPVSFLVCCWLRIDRGD
jgi:hypothetical protein